jgi:recombination protein RecR
LSPLEGVGPEALRVKELVERAREGLDEVVLALDPDVEGDATSLYVARLLKPLGVRVTRLASGLPSGAELDYADPVTLARAMQARRDL